ncbi:uncharacterized protein BO97DRAFT_445489 [Aspergillus homomorphus CBS 101889]|uniref:Uncharacterized protein n=1 Tax=Aspergillus homomorphus (strain CBS 101889) TaxID=1450537 RepID=A0A395HQ32_ASPHC|nr:hypothetical protein BO97DRAFT_445489 [Aspergillus homomorphus CBS 101889]RAL09385.1 hypothetical protein BO97DRAFT_445489 [Aspergillus homomorphus CBS 101889]
MTETSRSSRRRNGKPAPCEPFRKDKAKHENTSAAINTARRPSQELSPLELSDCNPGLDTPLPAGYLGPTSCLDAFSEAREVDKQPPTLTKTEAVTPYWVPKVAEILRWLQDLAVVEQLVHEYYRISQSAAIPAPFILHALASLSVDTLLTALLQNTGQRLVIPRTTEGGQFLGLFTGAQLRLDIGVIAAIAGKASCFALTHGQAVELFRPRVPSLFPPTHDRHSTRTDETRKTRRSSNEHPGSVCALSSAPSA